MGCFRDETTNPRPLPILVKNFRWPGQIDWNDLNKTIEACALKVKEAGFVYFGLQFYGECWSGPKAHLTYDEDGKSKGCIVGVGKPRANFVYRLVFEGTHYRLSIVNTVGNSPLRHLYSGDTSFQTQNLVPEKCSHNRCICYLLIERTPLYIKGKGPLFLGPKTRL